MRGGDPVPGHGCLDEIGQADERRVGETAYMLANGQGKQRAGKSGSAKAVASWRLLLVSNGEQPLSAIMAKTGRQANAGQEVRLVHIEADAEANMGIFENIHGEASPAEFAKLLDDMSNNYHGTVGVEWLRKVVENRPKLQNEIKEFIQRFCKAVVPVGASGQVERVARRFGLVAAAGELATEYGLTGWPKDEATSAAQKCFDSWLETSDGIGDREELDIISNARAFLENHGSSKFEATDGVSGQKTQNRAGFWRDIGDDQREYLVLPEAFKGELCKGFAKKAVTDALKNAGILIPDKGGRPSQPHRLPGMGKNPIRVYVLRYNPD